MLTSADFFNTWNGQDLFEYQFGRHNCFLHVNYSGKVVTELSEVEGTVRTECDIERKKGNKNKYINKRLWLKENGVVWGWLTLIACMEYDDSGEEETEYFWFDNSSILIDLLTEV